MHMWLRRFVGGLAIGGVLASGAFGQGRPGPDRKETTRNDKPKEPRRETKPEPRRETKPEPRRETKPEPRRETKPEPRREPKSEPRRDMPDRNSGGAKGEGVRSPNGQSFEILREDAARRQAEAERSRAERERREELEREEEARLQAAEEAEEKERTRQIAALQDEIARLEAKDRARAEELRREVARREAAFRDWRRERQLNRELRAARRANPAAVVAPPVGVAAKVRGGKVGRAEGAKPAKPVEPPPEPLTEEQLNGALEDLASDDPKRIREALERLAKVPAGDQRAKVSAALVPHLESTDRARRKAAAQALAVWADAERLEPLVGLLKDLDKTARHHAFETFAALGDPRTIEPLVERLAIPEDRQAAADALRELGPEAARAAAKHARHDEMWVRAAVAELLGEIGRPEDKDLLRDLAENDPEGFVRNKAATALKQAGG